MIYYVDRYAHPIYVWCFICNTCVEHVSFTYVCYTCIIHIFVYMYYTHISTHLIYTCITDAVLCVYTIELYYICKTCVQMFYTWITYVWFTYVMHQNTTHALHEYHPCIKCMVHLQVYSLYNHFCSEQDTKIIMTS